MKNQRVFYYHMTSLDKLCSIAEQGLITQKRTQRKTYWRRKSESLFSEGVEGAIALFVDFQIVYDKIKTKQMTVADKDIENRLLQSLIFFMF